MNFSFIAICWGWLPPWGSTRGRVCLRSRRKEAAFQSGCECASTFLRGKFVSCSTIFQKGLVMLHMNQQPVKGKRQSPCCGPWTEKLTWESKVAFIWLGRGLWEGVSRGDGQTKKSTGTSWISGRGAVYSGLSGGIGKSKEWSPDNQKRREMQL